MSEWKEYRLSDIADILNAKRIPLNSQEREKRKGNYPYYGASGIVDYINGYIFDGEHVLISEDGENLRSRTTPIAFKANGKFWVNNHAHIVKGKKPFLNGWIIYYFKNIDINPYITGAVQPKLNKENLLSIPIYLPDFITTEQITEILSSLDDKIELNNKINKNLEDLAQALFKQWFVDFEFPNENGEPYKSSGGEMVESELGEIPKEWKITTLETIAKVIDPHPSHRAPKEVDVGYPFAGIGDIDEFGNIDIKNARKISEESIIDQEASYSINDKTIGYGRVGTVGKVVRLRPRSYRYAISPTLAVIDPIQDDLALFTLILLKSKLFYQRMLEYESGTTRPTIGIQALRKISFPFPKNLYDRILKEYCTSLGSINTEIDVLNCENQSLINLRDTLLPKLISGKLEINEALLQTEKAR